MIDFHSHILPAMDDGSRSVEESRAMLERLASQGVTKVIATPHFYANRESVSAFLERRRVAYETLTAAADPAWPTVVPGAEVRYYRGIGGLDGLKDLCIGDSNVLLLEMTSIRWTESVIREIVNFAYGSNLTVVLAHVERYFRSQSPDVWTTLRENGVRMQLSCDYFKRWFDRRKALNLIQSGQVQMLGTDCHNLTDRAPDMDCAISAIRDRFGEDFLREMDSFGEALLSRKATQPTLI